MTKQEQLATLVWASEELNNYVSNLAYMGVPTENEAKDFDDIIEKINKVAEEIRHEITPPTYAYAIHEDGYGIIGYHKTFEGAKKQLTESTDYQELADNYPLDYERETCWGWDVLFIERIKIKE